MRITLLAMIFISLASAASKPRPELIEIRRHMECGSQCTIFGIWEHDGGEPTVITMICSTLYATCQDVEPGTVQAKIIPMNKEYSMTRARILPTMTPEYQAQTTVICLELATRPYPVIYWVQFSTPMTAEEKEYWKREKEARKK
jgi:hypothetical protein